MKAEQRKELETNTLADKVGQAMQRVKTGSRRGVLLYVLAAIALIIVAWGLWRWYQVTKKDDSLMWVMLDDGSAAHLTELFSKEGTEPGKAARLQIAWLTYWDEGVRMIGVDPQGSMKKFKLASDIYKKVAEESKDDPIFEPQALLGIAVVEETKAVQDLAALKRATEAYQVVVDKYGKDDDKGRPVASAEALFAQKRLDILKDKAKREKLEEIYTKMQQDLHVPGFGGGLFPRDGLPPLPKGKDDDKK
jgi:hypothetical protein